MAFQHFKKQACAATRRVLLFARDHEAGAHGATLDAAARTNAYTAQGGTGKTALVVRELEMRFELRRMVRGTEAQVFVHAIGVHYLTRVHLAPGIPDGLKFLEGCDQFWSEHHWQEFGAGLPVAVFS